MAGVCYAYFLRIASVTTRDGYWGGGVGCVISRAVLGGGWRIKGGACKHAPYGSMVSFAFVIWRPLDQSNRVNLQHQNWRSKKYAESYSTSQKGASLVYK